MKKLLVCLFIALCLVSCSWFEAKMTEEEMFELVLTETAVANVYKYQGEAPDKDYDAVLLVADETDIKLGENCLGEYKGHVKKVYVSTAFTTAEFDSFSYDSVLEEVHFKGTCDVNEEAFYECTALTKVTINGEDSPLSNYTITD